MYASLVPYQKKGFKEQDLFTFDFEKVEDSGVDLEEEMRLVSEQKEYWEKVDRQRELSRN